ncbi:MAG: WhiB family transcriptional regulator [Streptosporangiaceae bacterium]
MTISPLPSLGTGPGALTDEELQYFVASPLAGCADTPLDPDEWFPISAQAARARSEASRALAVCTACPIRAECLEVSLRQWNDAGQHGIWGGFVEADRHSLRREWRQGVPVRTLLARQPQTRRPGRATQTSPGPGQGPAVDP